MPQRRPILVWLLLVVFAVGGVAGPALHQVQHATEEAADRSETPYHAPGVHTAEGAVWADAVADLQILECDLCATRLLVVFPTPAPTSTPLVVGTTAVGAGSHVTAAHVAADRFIRGPPSLSEARPA